MHELDEAGAVQHINEPVSNEWRQRAAHSETRSLRTFTPSLAVIARSEGCYHYTCEGRKLADFSSGVLVANLGHQPREWWEAVLKYMGFDESAEPQLAPLTAYNAITPLEVLASERLIANMRAQPGGERMERIIWAASGSEAIQKAMWCAMYRDPHRQMVIATRRGFHGKKGLAGAVTGSEHDKERDPRVRFVAFPLEQCADVEQRDECVVFWEERAYCVVESR